MAVVEVSKRWYIGRGKQGILRLKNLVKLADAIAGKNVSKLVNDALCQHYNLDPDTFEPRTPPKTTSSK